MFVHGAAVSAQSLLTANWTSNVEVYNTLIACIRVHIKNFPSGLRRRGLSYRRDQCLGYNEQLHMRKKYCLVTNNPDELTLQKASGTTSLKAAEAL